MVQDPVKNYIRAPEGKYQLHSEKAHSCSFSPPRQTRLTYATVELQPGTASKYVIFNSSDALCISPYASIEKPPVRQILVSGSNTQQTVYPSCHDFAPNVKGYDLVVGLSSGDVVLGSLHAQLTAAASNFKMLEMLHFNKGGSIDSSRAVDVAFLPGTHGGYIVAAHESGNLHMYCTSASSLSNGSFSSAKGGSPKGVMNPTITIKVCEKDLRSATVSPDGSKVASTNKEGVLYVHDLSSGQLIGGFKSFSGGLSCCAWSYDSQYIATGGEDDLICVYGLTEQAQVFWGEGHTSWITRIGFDRWESEVGSGAEEASSISHLHLPAPERTRYRIVSLGQDCQVFFWDFVVEDGEYLTEDSETRTPGPPEPSGRVHKRTQSRSTADLVSLESCDSQAGATNGLPSLIRPASKQSQMILSSPVASQL